MFSSLVHEPLRLDLFLSELFPVLSRSQWTQIIESKQVLINEKPAKKSSQKIHYKDLVSFHAREQIPSLVTHNSEERAEELFSKIKILWEDCDLIILHKPENLVVHQAPHIPHAMTLAYWLEQQKDFGLKQSWEEDLVNYKRRGIVHRLDRATSGLMLCAKNMRSHRALSDKIQKREIHRIYFALGKSPTKTPFPSFPPKFRQLLKENKIALKKDKEGIFTLGTWHKRSARNPLRFSLEEESSARKAISQFQILDQNEENIFLSFKLKTGRSHQIRLHAEALGLPLLGDPLYSGQEHPRLMLHSQEIALKHPFSQKELHLKDSSPSFMETLNAYKISYKEEALLWNV